MRKRWTGEMVREFVESEGYELVIVPNWDWVKSSDRIWVSCGHHEKYDVSWDKFYSNRRCPKCANKKRNESKTFSHEKICRKINELDSNYYVCKDSPRYRNAKTKLKLSCGKHFYYVNWIGFMIGNRCPHCSGSYKYNHQEICEEVNKLDMNYKVCDNSPKYKNCHTKLKLYHSTCGNKFDVTWNEFRNGRRPCGCYSNSKNEILIRDYLKEKGISFKEQVKFNNLVSDKGNKLRYDFGIYREDKLSFLLEYDGEQHFRPATFGGISQEQAEENFTKQQYHDKLKNDYAKENNIPLLRIRYDEDTIFVLENYLKGLQLIKEDDIINLTKKE